MGIPGLLPSLNSITNNVHISDLSNKTVAIDIYCWLHKGAYSCSSELCQNLPTNGYITYCMKRIDLLLQYNIKPIVIFDGGSLPIKSRTNSDRKRTRAEFRNRGMKLLREGNVSAARECFQKAIDITPEMAHRLIKVLRQQNISYIVAPYEADAQIALLSLRGHVECVITEDSDLIAYGCPRIIFKLESNGNGKEICLSNLGATKNPCFVNFTMEMFRQVCILAGCDYLQSISGLGIKRAHAIMKKYRSVDKVISALRIDPNFIVPEDYEEQFRKAELTFLHQRVFDPDKQSIVPLTSFPAHFDEESFDFLGPELPCQVARDIASGRICPITKVPFEISDENSAPSSTQNQVIPGVQSNRKKKRSLSTLPLQKNTISNYFTPVTIATSKPFVRPRRSSTPFRILEDNESFSYLSISKTDKMNCVDRRIGILAPRTPSPPPPSSPILYENDELLPKSSSFTSDHSQEADENDEASSKSPKKASTTTVIVSKRFKKQTEAMTVLPSVLEQSIPHFGVNLLSSPFVNCRQRRLTLSALDDKKSYLKQWLCESDPNDSIGCTNRFSDESSSQGTLSDLETEVIKSDEKCPNNHHTLS